MLITPYLEAICEAGVCVKWEMNIENCLIDNEEFYKILVAYKNCSSIGFRSCTLITGRIDVSTLSTELLYLFNTSFVWNPLAPA